MAGEPRPPAPMNSTFESSSLACPSTPTSGIEQVAAVALLLLGRQDDRRGPRAALRLPLLEAAAHRRDVGVAHLAQRLGREQRADAARAVEDHRACRGRATAASICCSR